MDRRRLVAALVVVALVALAGCDGRPPKTEVVCDGCTTGITEGAPGVTVEDSVTHVYLQDDGGARVEARMRLSGEGVADLRANESRQAHVARLIREGADEEEEDDYYGLSRPAFPREDLSVSVDGETVVVTYRWANVSDERFGATVLNGFYRYDGQGRETDRDADEPFETETDRMVVHGPEGTRTLVAPQGPTDRGDRVVWTSRTIDTRTYVVFGQGGPALGYAAVAAEVLSWAAGGAAFVGGVVAVPLGLLVALFAGYYPGHVRDTDGWDPGDDGLFWVLAGIDAVVVALALGAVAGGAVGALVGFVVGVVGVVAGYRYLARDDDTGDAESTDPGSTDGVPQSAGATGTGTPGQAATTQTTGGPTTETAAGGDGRATPSGQTAPGGRDQADDATPTAASANDGLLDRYGPHFLAVGAVLALTLVVTVAIAVDYTASYAGTVALVAMAVPLVAFVALGYLATRPGRGPVRAGVAVGTVVAPWIVSLGQVVNNGGHEGAAQILFTGLWGVGVGGVGLLAFYAVLWASTR